MLLGKMWNRVAVLKKNKRQRTILSFHMENIPRHLIEMRTEAIQKLLGSSIDLKSKQTNLRHPEAIDEELRQKKYDSMLILDFDCIPLNRQAIKKMFDAAERDVLTGAVQRANQFTNGGHLYVGPFCMAFTKNFYESIGEPSFNETARGDVGEELTYAAERLGRRIEMLWPSHVEKPMWPLTNYTSFGLGTTYNNDFWHAFTIRTEEGQASFKSKCAQIVQNHN